MRRAPVAEFIRAIYTSIFHFYNKLWFALSKHLVVHTVYDDVMTIRLGCGC